MSNGGFQIQVKVLLEAIGGTLVSGNPGTRLKGLSTDSRAVSPGQIFVALRGERFDGHDFVQVALERGAEGAVVQKEFLRRRQSCEGLLIAVEDTVQALGNLAHWWRKKHSVKVVAITGSVGKTTTKEMTTAILTRNHPTLKNEGNFNNLIGLPLSLLRLHGGHRRVVLEMGMNQPGEIARLTEIAEPHVGLITNVARAHVEGVGDLQGVADAKWELVEKMSPQGKVVINGEDRFLMKKVSGLATPPITFGMGGHNRIRAEEVCDRGLAGISFRIMDGEQSLPVRLKVPGFQNIQNALAAAAACICLGEGLEVIVKGLEDFGGLEGRFSVCLLSSGALLIDDTYNANPRSLKGALDSLSKIRGGGRRLVIGLGEMLELGRMAATAHREAGRWVAALRPDLFLVLGEHAQDMVQGALEADLPLRRTHIVKSPEEMARRIKQEMDEDLMIFLKGSRRTALDQVVRNLKQLWPEKPREDRPGGSVTHAV